MDKYHQQMEKALRAFEYTTEWADLVNALGKVNKVLSNHPHYPKIPCDAILGRRLAQCLHPGLPNGVQLKALETYDLLFKAIGSDYLMQELSKFSNGLFPLLSHADLNVKPTVLELYEVHFLPLNKRLRPALDGFLIATLHGLEENTDFFQRTDSLLIRVCTGVGQQFFYGSLWRCILIDPSSRLHGMNFLINHFNKKKPLESQLYILGTSIETLVEAICVSLLDIRNVLVQRAALDLLLCCFPLHNQQIQRNDMVKLVTGAVTVLLRRDTSLSRRLLAWIFNLESSSGKKFANQTYYQPGTSTANRGTAVGSTSETADPRKSREQREKERRVSYFNQFARGLLIEAFNNCLSNPSQIIDIPNCWSSLGDYWPYRLLICLIDHSELCELLIDDLCLDILRALCLEFRREENQRPEFIRTVRLLLTSMNISYLWSRVHNLLAEVCSDRRKYPHVVRPRFQRITPEGVCYVRDVGSGPTDVLELCATFKFMLDCFPIENYVEVAKDSLPKILANLLDLVIAHCDLFDISECIQLAEVIHQIFFAISSLYRDNSLLKQAKACASISQLPAPFRSNQISLVTEDEEYIAEEPVEQSIEGSSGMAEDNNQDKSGSENQVPMEFVDNGTPPSLRSLVAKFQALYHTFFVQRMIPLHDIDYEMEIFERKLQSNGLEPYDFMEVDKIYIDDDLTDIYRSLCTIARLISELQIGREAPCDARGRATAAGSSSASTGGSIPNEAAAVAEEPNVQVSRDPGNVQAGESLAEPISEERCDERKAAGPSSAPRAPIPPKLSFSACSKYVQDLMLLSCKAENIDMNYASLNLMLNMICTAKLVKEPEFAEKYCLDGTNPASFSEELNMSVDASMNRTNSGYQEYRRPIRILTDAEYQYITKDSCWFTLVMKVLWQNISTQPMRWIDTVAMIQNMHILTYNSSECEDVICASLNSSSDEIAYEARRRFVLLFFLMKTDKTDLNLRPREFERPLFIMMDSLASKMDPYNSIGRDWLTQVYKFRATARVLEPILKILLHPDTVRTPIVLTKISLTVPHHTFMHLYTRLYDSQRIIYALNTLWNMLINDPHQGLIRMANCSIKGCRDLYDLYARHLNAVSGNSFDDDVSLGANGPTPTFLELTISTCLNFLSSYYTILPTAQLSLTDIHGNQRVRLLAAEILRLIFSNLFEAVKGCPTHPIHDLLNRCKVQENILQQLATAVNCAQHTDINYPPASSEQIIHFNETASDSLDDFQRTLLKLLEELMNLEYRVIPPNIISETEIHSHTARTRDIPEISSNTLKYFYNIPISSQRLFLAAVRAALQNVERAHLHINWLSMVETTLPISGKSLTRWIGCIVSRLCDNLELISNCIVNRTDPTKMEMAVTPAYLSILLSSLSYLTHYCLLDHNAVVSKAYNNGASTSSGKGGNGHLGSLSQRSESLSTLMPSASINASFYGGLSSGSTTTLTSAGTSGPSSLGPMSHVVSNILHVFSSESNSSSGIGSGQQASSTLSQNDPILQARKEVVNKLSQIIFALIHTWKAMAVDKSPWLVIGSPTDVKRQILSLLSPITLRYGVQFMNAVAIVWYELRNKQQQQQQQQQQDDLEPPPRKEVIPPCSADQTLLVEIVASISDLPMELVLQTTRKVIARSADPRNAVTTSTGRRIPLEVGLLQFFLAYIRLFPGSQLIECWKPLLQLIRDGLLLGRPSLPQAQFTLLALLHEFVQTAPLIEDRKDQKDLQEVAQKLIDALTAVVAARLAQTRWLRRALEVEPGPQQDVTTDDEDEEPIDEAAAAATRNSNASGDDADGSGGPGSGQAGGPSGGGGGNGNGPNSMANSDDNNNNASSSASNNASNNHLARYSVQALNALAEYVAPVLDVVYASDEKEKVVALITNIMYYVNPYLRNHQAHNSPSFLACSHLLSSISGYQYTRKAWRRDALDLLIDPQFFQMDSPCMEHWRVIVDHLMTHDKTTFRDFLGRMAITQSSGALKLFASRDQENEQRAQLIKRMAFILFCSERDQYHKYTPEIQEKLIESLRDNPSEHVQSQIMLCFRVLIIRSSAHLLTSLWPFVYTEMVQGLLDIEAYLDQSVAAAAAAAVGGPVAGPSGLASGALAASALLASHSSAGCAGTGGTGIGSGSGGAGGSGGSGGGASAGGGAGSGGSAGSGGASDSNKSGAPQRPPSSLDRLQIGPNTVGRFQLFLYTCKLLDMVLSLPADSLPQFQMYRWSFIGSGDDFEPHLVRIERRLTELNRCMVLLPYRKHYPILTLRKIDNLLDLHPFFRTLVKVYRGEYEYEANLNLNDEDVVEAYRQFLDPNLIPYNYDDPNKFIDAILESDFLVEAPPPPAPAPAPQQ